MMDNSRLNLQDVGEDREQIRETKSPRPSAEKLAIRRISTTANNIYDALNAEQDFNFLRSTFFDSVKKAEQPKKNETRQRRNYDFLESQRQIITAPKEQKKPSDEYRVSKAPKDVAPAPAPAPVDGASKEKLDVLLQNYKLARIQNQENSHISIKRMDHMDKILIYSDSYPLLAARKYLYHKFLRLQHLLRKVMDHFLFELIVLSIIITNTVIYIIDASRAYNSEDDKISEKWELTFVILYTIEMGLKIIGYGPFSKRPFYRSAWTLFDIFIVIVSWLSYLNVGNVTNFSVFRSLKLFRIYKIIGSSKTLKYRISHFLYTIHYFIEIILIMLFFYSIFAIAGHKIFSGVLQKKCVYRDPAGQALLAVSEGFCFNDAVCPDSALCTEGFPDPLKPIANFDNYFNSLYVAFQVSVLEGWYELMLSLCDAFPGYIQPLVYLYFIALIFICNIFILNLIRAIIIVQYNKSEKIIGDIRFQKRTHLIESEAFDLLQLKVCQYFNELYYITSLDSLPAKQRLQLFQNPPPTTRETLDGPRKVTSSQSMLELPELQSDEESFENDYIHQEVLRLAPRKDLKDAAKGSSKNFDLKRALSHISKSDEHLYLSSKLRPQEFHILDRPAYFDGRNSPNNESSFISLKTLSQSELRSLLRTNTYQLSENTLTGLQQKFKKRKSVFQQILSSWKKDKDKKIKIGISDDVPNPQYYIFDSREDILPVPKSSDALSLDTASAKHKPIKAKYLMDLILYERASKIINKNYSKYIQIIDTIDIENKLKELKFKNIRSVYRLTDPVVFQKSFIHRHKHNIWQQIYDCVTLYYFLERAPLIFAKDKPQRPNKVTLDHKFQVYSHILKSKLSKMASTKISLRNFFSHEFKASAPKQADAGESLASSNTLLFASVLEYDSRLSKKVSRLWSGFDCLSADMVVIEKNSAIFHQLNSYNPKIWLKGFRGKVTEWRADLLQFVKSGLFSFVIISFVILNTITLCLYGLISEEREYVLENINVVCTIVFIVEMALKLMAMGLVRYFRRPSNVLDAVIVAFSIADFVSDSGSGSSTAIRALRLFRIFRVVKVVRILRYLRFITVIMHVLYKSWRKMKYTIVILLTFILMFSLIGFTLFNKTLDGAYPGGHKDLNFDNIAESIIYTFNIMTLDNWDNGATILVQSTQSRIAAMMFYFIWTFVGSIVVLNFFFATILEGFSEPSTVDIIKELSKEEKTIVLIFDEKVEGLQKIAELKKRADATIDRFRKLDFKNFILPYAIKKQAFRDVVLQQNYELDLVDSNEYAVESLQTSLAMILNFDDDQLPKLANLPMHVQDASSRKLCACALFIFTPDSWLRRRVIRVVESIWFTAFMISVIIANCICFVLFSYKSSLSDGFYKAVAGIDFALSVVIIVEFCLKAVAYGFILCKRAYARSAWGVFDFIVVALIVGDLIVDSEEYSTSWLKIIRITRIFRLISHVKYFQKTLHNLYNSFSAIGNVLIIIFIYFLVYGILGITFLRNKMSYCGDLGGNVIYDKGKDVCLKEGLRWLTYDWNFDNIINSLITLYVVAFLDNSQTIMFRAADASDAATGAVYRHNAYIFIYFVSYILLVVFVIFNLGMGVIYVQYQIQEESKRREYNELSATDRRWLFFLKALSKTFPSFVRGSAQSHRLGAYIIKFYYTRAFTYLVRGLILLSVVILALSFEGMPYRYELALEITQMVINGLFIVELLVKIYAQGSLFFYNRWNIFELFLVILSLGDIALFIIVFASSDYKFAYQIYKITRIIRIMRLFQITTMSALRELDKIINAFILIVPSIMDILSILLLVYFAYAMLAITAFKDAAVPEFENFGVAYLNMFRFSTGENWSLVMWQLNKVYPFWGTLFFVSFVFISTYLLFNMFVLIMIDQFQNYFLDPKSTANAFTEYLGQFNALWEIFSGKYGGKQIRENQLLDFFVSLKAPLGFNASGTKYDKLNLYSKLNFSVDIFYNDLEVPKPLVLSKISSFKIPVDKDGFVKYHFVLYGALKLSIEFNGQGSEYEKKPLIRKAERKLLDRLAKMRINRCKKGIKAYATPKMGHVFLQCMIQAWASKAARDLV